MKYSLVWQTFSEEKKFLTDLKAMKAIDNYFCQGLKCKMCIEARFLNKKFRHFTGNFSSIFHFSIPMLHIQATRN